MGSPSYISKLEYINGVDPYSLKVGDLTASLDDIPKISKSVVMDYLLFRTSSVTNDEIRACKSLEAFAQLACKWIQSVGAKKINERYLIVGKVRHSQRLSEAPLKPWIVVSAEGAILACHCNCVAGLGEVCTHVAAVLFALEYAGVHEEKSVTDVLAYWIGPSRKGEFYKRLADIDFSTPASLLAEENAGEIAHVVPTIPTLSNEEINSFYLKMKDLNMLTASMLPKKEFHPEKTFDDTFPKPLAMLFDKKYEKLNLEEIRDVSKTINVEITKEQATAVHEKTLGQSSSKLWFEFRAGRITASKFKSACCTKVENPSTSLIRTICYPAREKKFFKAGIYGCKHEDVALDAYIKNHIQKHPESKIEKCGLILNPSYPYFGATPDGILNCSQCGLGCIEVKCPYCVRDAPIEEIINFKSSCLLLEGETFKLNKKHAYFYQVQMQMALAEKSFCDFVVWTPQNFFFERVMRDYEFWHAESEKAKVFFYEVIFPELLGQYYTKKALSNQISSKVETRVENNDFEINISATCSRAGDGITVESIASTSSQTSAIDSVIKDEDGQEKVSEKAVQLWCYCKTPDDGSKMVICDNRGCTIQWFHRRCIQVKRLPKGKWFCESCSKTQT